MDYELQNLTANELAVLDVSINDLISEIRNSPAEITRYSMTAMSCITSKASRQYALTNQNPIKSFFNDLTGKNSQIAKTIQDDERKFAEANMRLISAISEQNLMTLELVTALNNKYNTEFTSVRSEIEVLSEDITKVLEVLEKVFNNTRSKIVNHESRIEQLEQSVGILKWKNSIAFQAYKGNKYSSLPKNTLFICMISDFIEKSGGKWNFDDLLLLQAVLQESGINPTDPIRLDEFYTALLSDITAVQDKFIY